jgi:phage terminase large subunit-like protein
VAFYQDQADIACNFFEKVLKHTADEWWGKPFMLAPWEEEALNQIFGNLDSDGLRIVQQVYLEVTKKSGKTEFAAGLLLLLMTLSKAPGFQAYGAAAATRQAMNVYRACCKMVEQAPILQRQVRILRGTNRIVKRQDPDSFYAAVAADGDFGDGVNPAVTVADEVHRWKTRKQLENWDVLSKGGITRRQTLTIAITTAGVQDESPLAWMLHEKTRKIQDGIVSDARFYGRIYAADKTDDPADPKTWIKACPSLIENGGFLDKEKIREKYESAVAEGDLTSFKRYFLNIWDSKENRAIDMARWDLGAKKWKAAGLLPEAGPTLINGHQVRPLPYDLMARFAGRRCWAGVDLSMRNDTTSVVFLFPNDDDSYDILPFCWLPDADIRRLEVKLSVPLQQWARDGFLELCHGPYVDYREVRARLEWGWQKFDLQQICWDPWNSREISASMLDDGFPCVEVRQGYATLSEPTKKVLELIANGKLHHGGHPVARWQAGCACTITDGKSNLMFTKPDLNKSASRTDIPLSIADAMAGAIVAQDNSVGVRGLAG